MTPVLDQQEQLKQVLLSDSDISLRVVSFPYFNI